jgi:hypothetical protein
LLIAVGRQGATGQHLLAFFGCLFLAALRPAEATALTDRFDEGPAPFPADVGDLPGAFGEQKPAR